MGLIVPNKNKSVAQEFNKRVLGDIVIRKLNQQFDDGESVTTAAEKVVDRLLATAIAAESNKDASTAAKLLFEYSMGKAGVVVDDTKEELPAVKITVSAKSKEKLLELSQRTEFTEDDEENEKFIIEDENGTIEVTP